MKPKPFIIGVAGGTGSGKSTVVRAIVNNLNSEDITIIQHDSYYKDRSHLSNSEREKINYDHPDALETNLLGKHLKDLIHGKEIEIPIYDFTAHTRKKEGKIVVSPKTIIVEGILIFTDPALCELLDIKIFIDTDDDIRFIRRLQRDISQRNRTIESVIKQYLETVRPMHIEFVEPSRKYADIIVTEGRNPVAIEMIISMIKDKIS